MVVPGALLAGGGTGEAPANREALKDSSPWLGGRTESPSMVRRRGGGRGLRGMRGLVLHFGSAGSRWDAFGVAVERSRALFATRSTF